MEIDFKWDRVKVRIENEGSFTWPVDIDEVRYPGTNKQPILVKPASPSSSLKSIRPNYDNMLRLLADGNPADRVTADPRESPVVNWERRAVRLQGQKSFSESPEEFIVLSKPSPLAIILHVDVHHEDSFPRLEIVDLQTRKPVLTGPAPPGTRRIVASPSGTLLATVQAEDHGDSAVGGQVDFWKFEDLKISHLISFSPYVMNTWPDADVKWLSWLDDQRLFTLNEEGQLILWQVESAKAIYELKLNRKTKPILSHGRKFLVVPTSAGVQFFDATSGDLVAVVGEGNNLGSSIALSPTGKQLAIVSGGFIDVLDVTTGQATRSFPCKGANGAFATSWINEDYLYISNGRVVNVPLRLIAWQYITLATNDFLKNFAGHYWALLENAVNDDQFIFPLELPPLEAVNAVKNIDKKQLLVVQPGDEVQLDIQIHDEPFLAKDVKQALTEALVDAEMEIGDSGPLKLVARTKPGGTQKVYYRGTGAFHDVGQAVDVTNRIYELELTLNGSIVWRRESTHSAPSFLHLERGESIQDAINRVMKPTEEFFRSRLPSYVVSPEYLEPLGTSKLLFGF